MGMTKYADCGPGVCELCQIPTIFEVFAFHIVRPDPPLAERWSNRNIVLGEYRCQIMLRAVVRIPPEYNSNSELSRAIGLPQSRVPLQLLLARRRVNLD